MINEMESSIKSQLSVVDQRLDSIEANATSTELVSTNILYGSYTIHLLACKLYANYLRACELNLPANVVMLHPLYSLHVHRG